MHTSPQSSFSEPIAFEFISLVKNCKKYFRRHLSDALYGSKSISFSLQYILLDIFNKQGHISFSAVYEKFRLILQLAHICFLFPSVMHEDTPVSTVTPHFPLVVNFSSFLLLSVTKLKQNSKCN